MRAISNVGNSFNVFETVHSKWKSKASKLTAEIVITDVEDQRSAGLPCSESPQSDYTDYYTR